MNHLADIARRAAPVSEQAGPGYDHALFVALGKAAEAFEARTDAFAAGKADICRDLAVKLDRALGDYGSFSEKQEAFARKLISWAEPRERRASPAPAALYHPNIARLLCTFSRGFRCGDIKISLGKKGVYWVTAGGALVGVHEAQNTKLFAGKIAAAGLSVPAVERALATIEDDPIATLKASGRETGICGCCGLPLVDPVSVERGIGPICWAKGGF
jgi:hypothetical protein